jgi:hypothetical protein
LFFTNVEVLSNYCNPGARGRGRIVCFGFVRWLSFLWTLDAGFGVYQQYFYLLFDLFGDLNNLCQKFTEMSVPNQCRFCIHKGVIDLTKDKTGALMSKLNTVLTYKVWISPSA